MDYTELVKALRMCAGDDSDLECDCDSCMFKGKIVGSDYTGCVDAMMLAAADAIEELLPYMRQVEKGMGLLDKADALLNAVKPRWIPVEERLPEEGVSVQVCFRSQGGTAQAVSERFINDNNKSYWSGLCGMKPTHWMPLPEPPKEETE